MSVTREQAESFGVSVVADASSVAAGLARSLNYEELVEFIHMIDDEVGDSIFTDMLYQRIVEIRNELEL